MRCHKSWQCDKQTYNENRQIWTRICIPCWRPRICVSAWMCLWELFAHIDKCSLNSSEQVFMFLSVLNRNYLIPGVNMRKWQNSTLYEGAILKRKEIYKKSTIFRSGKRRWKNFIWRNRRTKFGTNVNTTNVIVSCICAFSQQVRAMLWSRQFLFSLESDSSYVASLRQYHVKKWCLFRLP